MSINLKEYFETKNGTSVLATSDSEGNVNAAIYSKPHVISDTEVEFIMLDKRCHKYVTSNPKAMFLFNEEGNKRAGIRLYLEKIAEEKNTPKIEELRKHFSRDSDTMKDRYLVTFKVTDIRPLVGDSF